MTRSLTFGLLAASLLVVSVAAQRPAPPPLDIRALSTKPELVSGGDVLVEVAGPPNLTVKNLVVRVNGRDVSAAFKPGAQSKGLVALVTGLQVERTRSRRRCAVARPSRS